MRLCQLHPERVAVVMYRGGWCGPCAADRVAEIPARHFLAGRDPYALPREEEVLELLELEGFHDAEAIA